MSRVVRESRTKVSQMNEPAKRELASEEMVVAAPMSFTGSAQRLWKLTKIEPAQEHGWAKALMVGFTLLLITLVWALVLCWYVIFGLLVVPYRLIRRGQRRRALEEQRHRELLAATQNAPDS